MERVEPPAGTDAGISLLRIDHRLDVVWIKGEAFLEMVGDCVVAAMQQPTLANHGLGSSALSLACRAAVAFVMRHFDAFGRGSQRLLVVEGLLHQTRQVQRKAVGAHKQGRELSPVQKLAMAGEVLNDSVALCHALIIVEEGCHVKVVNSEQVSDSTLTPTNRAKLVLTVPLIQDALLFLRVVHAKCEREERVEEEDSAGSSINEIDDEIDDDGVVVIGDSDEDEGNDGCDVIDLADSQEF